MTVERSLLMTQPSSAVYVEDVFSTYLYTGTGSTQTITNNINISGKGGLVWIKDRTNAYNHNLFDTERGATYWLHSNTTAVSTQDNNSLTSFNTSGFVLGSGNTSGSQVNTNTDNFVSWTFRKQPKFFDIVTYTGTGVARTISHNLGATPGMIIVKRTDGSGYWAVYHTSNGAAKIIFLNDPGAAYADSTYWNNTAPTSSVFTVGTSPDTNNNGWTYVAYLFADSNSGGFGLSGTDSVVACGSFTTDGSGLASVTLGWEPQFVIHKKSSGAGSWLTADTMRGTTTTSTNWLACESAMAEVNDTGTVLTPTSTGFSLKGHTASSTFIYLAIRRGPMKVPTDATKVYTNSSLAGGTTPGNMGFVPDMVLYRGRTDTSSSYTMNAARLRGGGLLATSSTAAEADMGANAYGWGSKTNYWYQNTVFSASPINWVFARAPGFFDVVCYTGTGSATTVAHNLGVAPEMMIVKNRVGPLTNWCVYVSPIGATKYLYLNTTDAESAYIGFWNNTSPTSTQFTLGGDNWVNGAGSTFVAYLFGTCPGVSKVGSYTGTAAALNIDCGFAAGARFIMIKRTDSTGDWYIYDSLRGISSGNDPYLLMNSTAVEVTNTNYVDAYATGFSLTATAPAGLNANGGTYIFLAIA